MPPRWEAAWRRLRDSAFVQNSLAYSGSNVMAQGASFVSALVVRRLLPPALMGYWNLRGVAQTALGTFDLGADIGAARELPLLAGQGRTAELARCRSTAFWFACLQSLVVTACWYAYILSRRGRYSALEFAALAISGVLFLLTDLQGVYVVFFRSAQAYGALSRIFLVSTVGEAVALPLAAWWGGIYGLFAAGVIAAGVRTAYLAVASRAAQAEVGLAFSKPILRQLVRFGAGTRIVDYPFSLGALLPSLWVARSMSVEDLALFSLASGMAAQLGEVSTRIGTVFITRFLERSGGAAAVEAQAEEVRKFVILQLLVAVPLLCWAGGALLPILLYGFIPKYAPALRSSLILLLSTFFMTVNSGLTVHWFAQGRLLPRGLASLAGFAWMALSILLFWLVFRLRTIDGMAWASVLGNAGYFATMVFAVGRDLWSPSISAGLLVGVLAAAAWTFLVLHFMGLGFASWGQAFARGALGLAAMLPLAAVGVWWSGLAQELA